MTELSMGIVVVAAGAGARFGRLKQFAQLSGRPLLEWTLASLESTPSVVEHILVVSPDMECEPEWVALHKGSAAQWKCIHGGRYRAESVRLGVAALSESIDIVAVHDGARPFPPVTALAEARMRLTAESSIAGVIIATRMVDTVKKLSRDGLTIEGTIEREGLARAETPQVCRREALLEALALEKHVTDEGHALEVAGFQTEVLFHDGWNPKITVPADLELAEAWLAARGSKS